MSDIICPECKTEYYLHHFKLPFKEPGETLRCKCGKELYSYDKGTDDYRLEEVGEYKKRMAALEEERSKYPTCDCGLKMVPRTGPYGNFFGCSKYPKGCKKIVKR
ncbi:hypothetical protein QNH39_13195 [Neobacillus novalis]|uniref:DNA topoisomerase type IA zn finger domain-containing protein n=1 Tax=Neobacillus novalis TaxID=220687 RepID=A0AA95MSP7_9BACI|nr:hypothetical protein [Neobacillus novalis]WHY88727.1 hypothetical protein QNH39_13195 [Neobacillus novalis]